VTDFGLKGTWFIIVIITTIIIIIVVIIIIIVVVIVISHYHHHNIARQVGIAHMFVPTSLSSYYAHMQEHAVDVFV
jgi:uncharacterized membrane protein